MSDLAADLVRRHDTLRADRSNWHGYWDEIADYARPLRVGFTGPPAKGAKRPGQDIFDGTAAQSAEALAAGLWGMITNAANDWFELTTTDPALAQDHGVKRWLDETSRLMHRAFAARGGQFYARVFELYADLACFGTAVFYVEDVPGEPILFSARDLSECVIAEDRFGRVDTVIRRFEMTARQADQTFGDALDGVVKKAVAETPDRKFPFLHAVLPAADVKAERAGGKPVASIYVDVTAKKAVRQGGFDEFPFQVPRWSTATGEIYGRSPAMMALADVKMLNQMARTTLEGAQKAVNPPVLAFDDGVYRPMRMYPGAVNYGGVTQEGRPLIQPYNPGSRVDIGLEMEEQRRQAIREAFYFSLMQMVGAPSMTATEVMARQEEKLRLLGPHLGRVQAEFLDPLIARVYAILDRRGELPPPPEAAAGAGLEVSYVSPLAKAQKSADGQAILRFLESALPLAQVDPGAVDHLDPDAAVRHLADAWGTPAALLRDPRAVEALRQQRAEAQAAMQQMEMLRQGAEAARAGGAGLKDLGAVVGVPGTGASVR